MSARCCGSCARYDPGRCGDAAMSVTARARGPTQRRNEFVANPVVDESSEWVVAGVSVAAGGVPGVLPMRLFFSSIVASAISLRRIETACSPNDRN